MRCRKKMKKKKTLITYYLILAKWTNSAKPLGSDKKCNLFKKSVNVNCRLLYYINIVFQNNHQIGAFK